jgi:hypothetical protein
MLPLHNTNNSIKNLHEYHDCKSAFSAHLIACNDPLQLSYNILPEPSA